MGNASSRGAKSETTEKGDSPLNNERKTTRKSSPVPKREPTSKTRVAVGSVSSRGMKRKAAGKSRRALKKPKMTASGADFYLDAIPKEVLDNVIKSLCHPPDVENWESHIPLRTTV